MTDYPIDPEQAIAWLRSKTTILEKSLVTLADLQTRHVNIPTVRADFDSDRSIGRISVWMTGEIDFEILCRTDAQLIFFRHESVENFQIPELDIAYEEFIQNMIDACKK
jgi:hypothetical protein